METKNSLSWKGKRGAETETPNELRGKSVGWGIPSFACDTSTIFDSCYAPGPNWKEVWATR